MTGYFLLVTPLPVRQEPRELAADEVEATMIRPLSRGMLSSDEPVRLKLVSSTSNNEEVEVDRWDEATGHTRWEISNHSQGLVFASLVRTS
jgi:hypothetical protein